MKRGTRLRCKNVPGFVVHLLHDANGPGARVRCVHSDGSLSMDAYSVMLDGYDPTDPDAVSKPIKRGEWNELVARGRAILAEPKRSVGDDERN